MRRAGTAVAACVLCALPLLAQGRLPVGSEAVTEYPSLVPRNVLKVSLPIGPAGWNPEHAKALQSYEVVDQTTQQRVPISAVHFPFFPDTQKPNYAIAYLVLPPRPPKHAVKVVIIDEDGTRHESGNVDLSKLPQLSFSVNPQAAPNEQLTTGAKRDVGQFAVTFDLPELSPNWRAARTYVHSENLFSTDERDSKSKFDVKTGIERSLLNSWLVPGHLEADVQGDQVANNLSFVTGGGVKAILPWAFTAQALNNSIAQIPFLPTFAFDIQYERRINQDVKSKAKFPNKNGMRLHEENLWAPINLVPGPLRNAVSVELHGQAWLLPLDKTKAGRGAPRLEGAGDASLLISLTPISKLPGLNLLMSTDPGKTRIRIKYSAGADEANGFKHSHQTTYGLELIK